MNNTIKKLTEFWKGTCVGAVCIIFSNAMVEMGFEKKDNRKKHQGKVFNSYNEANGHRATCLAFADSNDYYGNQVFEVVCRKKAGDYLIIGYEGERIFEIDYRGVINLNEAKLAECIKKYEPFFVRAGIAEQGGQNGNI